MPVTRTDQETFPKADGWTSDDVDKEQRLRLHNGAVSCDKSEDADNFYLLTVWNRI